MIQILLFLFSVLHGTTSICETPCSDIDTSESVVIYSMNWETITEPSLLPEKASTYISTMSKEKYTKKSACTMQFTDSAAIREFRLMMDSIIMLGQFPSKCRCNTRTVIILNKGRQHDTLYVCPEGGVCIINSKCYAGTRILCAIVSKYLNNDCFNSAIHCDSVFVRPSDFAFPERKSSK